MLAASLIAQRYEIKVRLGQPGSTGSVYLAYDRYLARTVAVKVLAEHLHADHSSRARFQREARALARVGHPNVVAIYDVDTDEDLQCDFLVMEAVAGDTLWQTLRTSGRLGVNETIDVLTQAADGLFAAHAQGVVHRDVKPSNLIREPGATVRVIDFGLAKYVQDDPGLTEIGSVPGTAGYLAPEVVRDESVDLPLLDVFALGVVAYELLTGQLPYGRPSIAQLFHLAEQPVVSPQELNGAIPDDLAAFVLRAIAPDPAGRPATMQDFLAQVTACTPETGSQGGPTRVYVPSNDSADTVLLPPAGASERRAHALILTVQVAHRGQPGTWAKWLAAQPGDVLQWLLTTKALGLKGVADPAVDVGVRVVLAPHLEVIHNATRIVNASGDEYLQGEDRSPALFSNGLGLGAFPAPGTGRYVIFETRVLKDFAGSSVLTRTFGHATADGIPEQISGPGHKRWNDDTSALVSIYRSPETPLDEADLEPFASA